jgi:hypothetical protein
MRNFVLIAAMVLASVAAAQAGESRSLITDSTAGATAPASVVTPLPNADQPAEPRAPGALRADNDTPAADVPRANDTPRTDAPRYNVRPAPVETPRAATTTPPAAQDTPGITNNDTPPRQNMTARPSREYHASRGYSRHQRGRLTAGRIIAALHRYGIYW